MAKYCCQEVPRGEPEISNPSPFLGDAMFKTISTRRLRMVANLIRLLKENVLFSKKKKKNGLSETRNK